MDKENNGMEKHVIWKKSARILLVFVLLVGILFSGQADVRAAGKKVVLNRTKVTLKVGESSRKKADLPRDRKKSRCRQSGCRQTG